MKPEVITKTALNAYNDLPEEEVWESISCQWPNHSLKSERELHTDGLDCACIPVVKVVCGVKVVAHNSVASRVVKKPDYHIEGTKQYPVPCGHYVLLRLQEFENTSEGGIILGTMTQEKREQAGIEVGEVLAFGPTAYKGWAGFEGSDAWGIKIGDIVEFKKYEGKQCHIEGYERFHFIPDSLLIGVTRSVDDE